MGKTYSGHLWIFKRPMILSIEKGRMDRVYGGGGKLLKAVQSFYVDRRACVRVGNDVKNSFQLMLD